MEFVSIDVTDGVAVLRLDRPKMNAISVQVQADLREVQLSEQQIADLAVGFGLRGMTLTGLFTYFATPAGWVYGAALICFALMPLMVHLRSQHGEVGVARR